MLKISHLILMTATFFLGIGSCFSQLSVFTVPQHPMDLSIVNYENKDEVLKFEKLELGVKPAASVMARINRFISKSPGQKINPFLEWEIKVEAEFSHPELDSTIVVDAFYFESFVGKMKYPLPNPGDGKCYSNDEYGTLGKYEKQVDSFPFRVRFAPPLTGEWSCVVHVILPENTRKTDTFTFKVIDSDNKGYIHVGENKRYLAHGDHSFLPVGCNMGWPQTRIEFDPFFARKNEIKPGGFLGEQYRPNHVVPRVYKSYRNVMDRMADNGANYFRMIMYPSATDIEWEELGNYSDRLSIAQEMDSILMKAEERDLFIQWNMQIHYCFQMSEHAYWSRWTWDNEVYGQRFCYTTIPGIEKDIDFFTNDIAKKYYKQRIRYIYSRWGYSTNIGVFSLFSEISNVGTRKADNAGFYREGENWKIYRDWQLEMAEYIKSMYAGRCHVLTGSYAGTIHPDDDTYHSEFMDIAGINFYDFGKPSFSGDFWNKFVAGRFLNDACDEGAAYMLECTDEGVKSYTKPMIFSETGPLEVESGCKKNHTETNRSMWQAAFSGLAASLSWDGWYFTDNYAVFGKINSFMSQFDLDGGNWHPGASRLKKYDTYTGWEFDKKYASGMDGKIAPNRWVGWKKRDRKADLSYLRSGDGTMAIGVISNKTYNMGSTDSCFVWEGLEGSIYEIPETIGCEDERLYLHGMKSGKYDIAYYYVDDLSKPIAYSSDRGTKVDIDCTLKPSKEGYLVVFVAKRREKK